MTKSIKGSITEQNLLKSFAGESQARNRYSYFAGQARKEGLVAIAMLFEKIAEQEKEHAKRFFSFLEGGELTIQATFPAGRIGTTLENLQAAAIGENEEHSKLYPEFAKIALEEGYPNIAALFNNVAVAEQHHEQQFKRFITKLMLDQIFKNNGTWQCLNCGYTHVGDEAPKFCPACAHPQAYFTDVCVV